MIEDRTWLAGIYGMPDRLCPILFDIRVESTAVNAAMSAILQTDLDTESAGTYKFLI